MEQKEDVLTRLDTLLNPSETTESGPSSTTSSNCSSNPSSILKTCSSHNKKKSIRFREDNDLQEVIGYGGEDDLDSSSDEEDSSNIHQTSSRFDEPPTDELTLEEKNVLNLTRQNTTFNTHAQNLNPESAPPLLRLGVDKKVTPVITVRPFGMRNEKAILKVQPMINGEVVSCKEDNNSSGRGESRQNGLNSDGASSESSSSEESDNNNSAPSSSNNNNSTHSRPTSVIEREFFKAKQSAATARLSFLNSTIAFEAKGEPTTDIVSNWVKTPEDEDEIDEAAKVNNNSSSNKKKNVKLTRKSPYVVGPYASTSILKGTPKPAVNVRKPPVPAKPEKLLASMSSSASSMSSSASSTSSSGSVSPIAAPRRNNHGIKPKNEYANVISEVTISADESTRIELSSTTSGDSEDSSNASSTFAECYTVNADVKNAIILDVCINEDSTFDENSEKEKDKESEEEIPYAPKLPKVQQNFNQIALDAIRKSLANKLSVQEELTNKDDEDVERIISKPPLSKTSSNSSSSTFEANRASVANALGFNRQDKVLRPSTKRQAPRPPPSPTNFSNILDTSSSDPEKVEEAEPLPKTKEVVTSTPTAPKAIPEPPPPPPEPLTPIVINTTPKPSIKSSIKRESSPSLNKNRESPIVKSVQFSPETVTMTLPVPEPDLQPISYNRWISRDPHGSPAIVESSFTGQPIAVQTPRPHVSHLNKKPVIQACNNSDPDEIRKWTEKKKGSRSKSLPRGGSEIDEILGSSKTKPPSRLFPGLVTSQPVSATATKPVHRQSRVELYENDRKRMRQNSKFSSIKKLFKLGSNPNLSMAESNAAVATASQASAVTANRRNSISSNEVKFMDKEHEREILERERSKLRPEIIHPLDLQSGGVEVVKITPKSQTQALYEKNQKVAGTGKPQGMVTKSILANKNSSAIHNNSKSDDAKDSGHETSSIHTENSEGSNEISPVPSSDSSDTGCNSPRQIKVRK